MIQALKFLQDFVKKSGFDMSFGWKYEVEERKEKMRENERIFRGREVGNEGNERI